MGDDWIIQFGSDLAAIVWSVALSGVQQKDSIFLFAAPLHSTCINSLCLDSQYHFRKASHYSINMLCCLANWPVSPHTGVWFSVELQNSKIQGTCMYLMSLLKGNRCIIDKENITVKIHSLRNRLKKNQYRISMTDFLSYSVLKWQWTMLLKKSDIKY